MANPEQAIDAHAHVFSATAPAVAGARYRPRYGADVAEWRSLWQAAGITHGVVVQPSFFGTDNREMLDTVAADPRRLRGVAVVTPLVDEAIIRRFDAQGVRGIRLNLRGLDDYSPYASAAWRDLYRRVDDAGWHVEVFVDVGRLPDIEPAFEGTDVSLVFDHFGSPGAQTGVVERTFASVGRLARVREVYVKLSGSYRLSGGEPAALAARWLDAVGPSGIVWGSDWPWTSHESGRDFARTRADLDDWVDARVARAALWDNAARLYAFT
jgi:predicted TIM-barrel fold metal-dependent hydrolase